MAFTNINNGKEYFNSVTYTGNGSTQSITGVGFQPEFTWIKNRSNIGDHALHDIIRGVTKRLDSNTTDAEITQSNGVTSFDSDGFSLGSAGNYNASSDSIVSWNWLAGGTASSNTDGSITSSVSANTDSGFSIVSYTANGVAGATIGHGLGAVPQVIITKDRDATSNWFMYHIGTDASAPEDKYMELESADAVQDFPVWNDTAPTSSVFSIGTAAGNNTNGNDIIAYCFTEKKGFSKFGSYTGNGNADGPFVYTGFKPAFVITKRTETSGFWWEMVDTAREPANPSDQTLYANRNDAEYTASGYNKDLLANGFKMRGTNGGHNASGGSYIYMAFAEHPFVSSTGTPVTAR